MQLSKIDWGVGPLYTWNPITGCKRGCSWCYARRIHTRFNKRPFSDIVFHEKRLMDIRKLKSGSTIFVGSMSDHEYWPGYEKTLIIKECASYPFNTFMFLSKTHASYFGFAWPANTMQGLTITGEDFGRNYTYINLQKKYPRPFLSIEPLLGIIPKTDYSKFERIIVGAMTGPGAVPVKPEWIQSIKDHCPAEKIFWKPSIKK